MTNEAIENTMKRGENARKYVFLFVNLSFFKIAAV